MLEQGAFAAAAAPHDDKDIPPLDVESQVPLDHERPVGHGEVAHADVGCRQLAYPSEAYLLANDIDSRIRDDQVDNRSDYRFGGGLAHRGGASA